MTERARTALVAGVTTPVGGAIADRLAADGFDLATEDGRLDVAVYAVVPHDSLTSRPLVQIDEDTFAEWCEAPIRVFLQWLQAVHARMADRHATVVLVAPTASQEGAAGLVPYTTAVEAQRLLAKSAARQWGADGPTVLIVAPRLGVVAADGPTSVDGTDADRTAPVLDAGSFSAEAVAGVVSLLVSAPPASRPLSGATIAVDGGALMAP